MLTEKEKFDISSDLKWYWSYANRMIDPYMDELNWLLSVNKVAHPIEAIEYALYIEDIYDDAEWEGDLRSIVITVRY